MKFATPVYPLEPVVDRIIEFKGLNRSPVIDDGEMRTMLNMSGDDYPCLTQRKPRGVALDYPSDIIDITLGYNPVAIIEKGRIEDGASVKKLAVIDNIGGGYVFKYDGTPYPNIVLSADTQMVAINTRICFFPEKLWFNVQTKEYGYLESSQSYDYLSLSSNGFSQALINPYHNHEDFTLGNVEQGIETDTISATLTFTPPSNSTLEVKYKRQVWHGGDANDVTWLEEIKSGFIKNGETQEAEIPSSTATGKKWKIIYDGNKTFTLQGTTRTAPSGAPTVPDKGLKATILQVSYWNQDTAPVYQFGRWFSAGDVVDIYGKIVIGENTYDYSDTPVSVRVESVDDYKMLIPDGTFLELAEQGEEEVFIYDVQIKRECPDLKHIIEYNNRLWGVDDSNNEIRASKLGDPTNWNYFQGESIDSYAATQGTDGEFTGAAAYSNHLLFFKEDYIHKVYGSKPSQYQIETATAFGVEKGSHKSIQIVNDTVFYKSRIGFMAYSGGTPFLVSEAFKTEKFSNVVSGDDGSKYYCSLQKQDGTYSMIVLDVATGMWHVEDATKVIDFCYYNGKLLMIVDDGSPYNKVLYPNADSGEASMPWAAEFGFFDEFIENKRIYSKLRMNLAMTSGSTITIKIKIDDGDWETVNHIEASEYFEENTIVVPRRCDRYSLRLEGTGKVQIRTLTRQYRLGTDRRDIR